MEDSLVAAVRDGDTAAVVELLQGAGHCPAQLLHHAVSSGHAHLVTTAQHTVSTVICYINTVTLQVSLLLSHPATDPNQPDPGGVTPVHLAALQGRDKIIRLMGGTEIVINVFSSPYLSPKLDKHQM